MWTTRRQAEKALEGPLRPVAGLLDEAFAMIDETIARLQEINPPFVTASALVLVKGRNLAMGCYSLSLDALAQEAGALFRPLIEACELLVYLGRDPARVNEIVEDRLPKAGKIAARIGGQLKPLRDHLSAHASHLSVSEESMRHLVKWAEGGVQAVQPFNLEVLRQNLQTLLGTAVWLMAGGVNCVTAGSGMVDEDFIGRAEDIRDRGFAVAKRAATVEPQPGA